MKLSPNSAIKIIRIVIFFGANKFSIQNSRKYLKEPEPQIKQTNSRNLAIIKNKGTPNLLNSSDNIDGTQTFLTQLSAVKLKSIEKRGKIQTTKMNKFSNLNICSTKREPNPQ